MLPFAISVSLEQVLLQRIARYSKHCTCAMTPDMFHQFVDYLSDLDKRQDNFDGLGTSRTAETLRLVVMHSAQKASIMGLEIAYGLAFTYNDDLKTMRGIEACYSESCTAHTQKVIRSFCELQDELYARH